MNVPTRWQANYAPNMPHRLLEQRRRDLPTNLSAMHSVMRLP